MLQLSAKRAVGVEHVGDAAAHARRRSCGRCGRARRRGRRSCTRSRDRRRLRPRRARRCCARRTARRPRRARTPRRWSRRRATTLPMMTFSSATNARRARRPDDEAAAREALADEVVGLAFERQRDAARQERAEALAGRAGEADADGVVGQARAAVAPGHLVAEQRPGRAIGVADRATPARPASGASSAGGGLRDERVIEHAVEAGVLSPHGAPAAPGGMSRHVQQRRQVEPCRLPVLRRRLEVEALGAADHLVERAEARAPPSARALPRR